MAVGTARKGRERAVARVSSRGERGVPELREVAAALAREPGRDQVVGITGAPRVGKSTAVSVLITRLRAAGQKVGVLAVDQSSPFSGGALLGDSMRTHAMEHPHIYMR